MQVNMPATSWLTWISIDDSITHFKQDRDVGSIKKLPLLLCLIHIQERFWNVMRCSHAESQFSNISVQHFPLPSEKKKSRDLFFWFVLLYFYSSFVGRSMHLYMYIMCNCCKRNDILLCLGLDILEIP